MEANKKDWELLRELETKIKKILGEHIYLGFVEHEEKLYITINFVYHTSYFNWGVCEETNCGDVNVTATMIDEDEGCILENETHTIFSYESGDISEWNDAKEYYKNKKEWEEWQQILEWHDELIVKINQTK